MSDICRILSNEYEYNIGYDKTLQKDLDTNKNIEDKNFTYIWFYNFIVLLLNPKSFELLNSINISESKLPLPIYKSIIKNIINNTLKELNFDDIYKDFIHKNTYLRDLYYYFINNNLYYYFLLPIFIKYLDINCLSFEYSNDNKELYGGICNYLVLEKNKLRIDDYKIKQSKGIKYDLRPDNHPDYILINIWDNANIDRFSYTIDNKPNKFEFDRKSDLPAEKIEFNGFEYILCSFLLADNKIIDKKVGTYHEQILSVTICGDRELYGYANKYDIVLKKPKTKYDYAMSIVKANEYYYIDAPCTKLNFIQHYSKKIGLNKNSCDFPITKEDKDKDKMHWFSIKEGNRVLVYIKGNKLSKDDKGKKDDKADIPLPDKVRDVKQLIKQGNQDQGDKGKVDIDKDKLCNTITDYLKKIKTNQDKDVIIDSIRTEQGKISKLIKDLDDKEKHFDGKKKELEALKKSIEDMQNKNIADIQKEITALTAALKPVQKRTQTGLV